MSIKFLKYGIADSVKRAKYDDVKWIVRKMVLALKNNLENTTGTHLLICI